MNTVNYQMSAKELLLTGFRRKFTRPRFLAALALLFGAGIFLILASDGRGGFFYAGLFAILYATLAPLQLFFALRRILAKYAWFTAPTALTFGDSGLAFSAPRLPRGVGLVTVSLLVAI